MRRPLNTSRRGKKKSEHSVFPFPIVRVTGTGQNSDGFAQGIYDNIIGDCKRSHRDITHRVNRNDDLDTLSSGFNYLTGEASWLYGVSLNLHFTTGAWTEGEDNKACVASAIRKAVCSTVELEDFECYNQADMPTDEL